MAVAYSSWGAFSTPYVMGLTAAWAAAVSERICRYVVLNFVWIRASGMTDGVMLPSARDVAVVW